MPESSDYAITVESDGWSLRVTLTEREFDCPAARLREAVGDESGRSLKTEEPSSDA